MSKLPRIENVNGIIIGECSKMVHLVAPNGNTQVKDWIGENDDTTEWGKVQKEKLLSQPTGNGNPIKDYPDLIEVIYGKGEWTVKEF